MIQSQNISVSIFRFVLLRAEIGVAVLVAGSASLSGCSGSLSEGTGTQPSEVGGAEGLAPDAADIGGAPTTSDPETVRSLTERLQNPPPEPALTAIACTDEALVPRGRIYRLSASGYRNSIQSSLGVSAVAGREAPFDGLVESGFSASAEHNVVSQPFADWYFDNAERIGEEMAPRVVTDYPCFTSAPATDDCVNGFVVRHGEALFRRPLDPAELARYLGLYRSWESELGALEAARSLLQGLTLSPYHLFRTERGSGSPGLVDLSHYEIASEISFQFGNGPPDAALLADASAGLLRDPMVVRGHAERLLRGPGGREVVQEFFKELLHLREVTSSVGAPAELIPSMIEESMGFIDQVVWDQGGNLEALFTATASPIDAPLAEFYGVAAPAAGASVETGRAGLLHQAAFLNARRDATHRGLFVRTELLCSPPALAPPEAQAVASTLTFDEESTAREMFAVIAAAGPTCATCHESFVPLGLAFENYDEQGRYRTEENGMPIDATGTFRAAGDLEGDFADSAEMVDRIIKSHLGQVCFTKRYLSYAQGRKPHGALDGCLIERARSRLVGDDLDLLSLMLEPTQDPSFYQRINLP